MPQEIPIRIVDSFTRSPYRGNPAGVVLHAGDLGEAQMQWIAEEIHATTTAFLLPPRARDTAFRMRCFTPRKEVPLSAHATIAALHALCEEGELPVEREGVHQFSVETSSGVLGVQVERGPDGDEYRVGLPIPEFEPAAVDREHLAELLGMSVFDLRGGYPLERYGDYLLLPLKTLDALRRIRPNFYGLIEYGRRTGLAAYACFTTETEEEGSRMQLRFFAPEEGVQEDPVTGEALGPCAVSLWTRGLVRGQGELLEVVGEQGDALGRPSRVRIRLGIVRKRVGSLLVGGGAVTVLRGSIRVPEVGERAERPEEPPRPPEA